MLRFVTNFAKSNSCKNPKLSFFYYSKGFTKAYYKNYTATKSVILITMNV